MRERCLLDVLTLSELAELLAHVATMTRCNLLLRIAAEVAQRAETAS